MSRDLSVQIPAAIVTELERVRTAWARRFSHRPTEAEMIRILIHLEHARIHAEVAALPPTQEKRR